MKSHYNNLYKEISTKKSILSNSSNKSKQTDNSKKSVKKIIQVIIKQIRQRLINEYRLKRKLF